MLTEHRNSPAPAAATLDAAGTRRFTSIEPWPDTIVRAHTFAHATRRPILVLVNLMDG